MLMLKPLFIALTLALAAPLHAETGGLPVSGELLPGWREADGRQVAGLSIRLAPGWKTYWRAPGEGGIPPRFNWSGSSNLASVDVRYPMPKIMEQFGIQVIGYDRDVVFPLIITARDRAKPVTIRAEVEIGVCQEVCIPTTLQLRGKLPEKGTYDAAIGTSLDLQPVRSGSFSCEIEPIADGLRLSAITPQPQMSVLAAVIETRNRDIWISPSTLSRAAGNLVATVEMVPPSAQPFSLARDEVRLTVIGKDAAVEMQGCR
jgi:DsbC/DsbD-like thiol-disulfide interchange protein